MRKIFQLTIALPLLAILCPSIIKAQNNIEIDLKNVLLAKDGRSATFEVWANASPSYIGSVSGWTTLLYRADASVGTYCITTVNILPTAAVDATSTADISNPGAPPVGSSKFELKFTRSNAEPDLVIGQSVKWAFVTLHFGISVKSGAANITPRSTPPYTTDESSIYTNGNGIEYPIASPNNSILPITIISFTGVKTNSGNLLNWTAQDASNFSHFELQRHSDGESFITIAKIDLNNIGNYSYTDAGVLGTNYYRLVAIDLDNSAQYSSIIALVSNANAFTIANIYPIPAINVLNVALYAPITTNVTYTIFNINGKIISKEVHTASTATTQSFDVAGFAHGTYLLTISTDAVCSATKFIKL